MSSDRLADAQLAMKYGNKVKAQRILSQVIRSDPHNEQAWLMMARLVNTEQQVIECLEWALKSNPDNRSTKAALKALKGHAAAQGQTSITQTTTAPIQPVKGDKDTIPAKPVPGKPVEKSITLAKVNGGDFTPPHRRVNWSLLIGSIIVLTVYLIGVIGPMIAPQDPMEEHAVLQQDGEWFVPPFSAFQVQGYILGSDEFGRDLFSRILYAVRPTLIMVSIVAIVRLFLGTLIGLGAGWSNGRIGRILNGMISAALSVPVFIVALAAIAMLGAEIGLLAFVVGLSINGWGETARFVREQTVLIKGQLYIESAHSLGASSFQMLVRHVLRQIMPMVWMLFAFEISGTLMVTAGLGFLGYFIGGDVWVEVRDFVSRRTSGAPELGQMLATSWVSLLQPWPLVLTGSVIFITVLGFNLLGDGLRSRLNPEYINRNSPLALLSQRFNFWLEQSVSYPVSNWLKTNRLRPALVITAGLALVGIFYLYQTRIVGRFDPSQTALSIPGGQLWASGRIDPYGTLFINSTGLKDPQKLWVVNHPGGFSGTPVVSADGTIYVAGMDSTLTAVNPDGTIRWETILPEIPVGPLALGPQGIVYVTDAKGGISALSPDGNLLWLYSMGTIGKPEHGAIVAPNGTIYCLMEDARGDTLFALLPNGQLLWSMQPGTHDANTGLRLTPDGQHIFIKNRVVNAYNGSIIDLVLPTDEDPILSNKAQLFVGADGKTYLLAGHVVMQWTLSSQGFNLVQSAEWNYRGAGISQTSGYPVDAGATAKGDIWIFYSAQYGGTSSFWLDSTGKILGSFYTPFDQDAHLIAIDGTDTSYTCGITYNEEQAPMTICEAYHKDNSEPRWTYTFPEGVYDVMGGAMAPGRLYLITDDDNLTALGESGVPEPVLTGTP